MAIPPGLYGMAECTRLHLRANVGTGGPASVAVKACPRAVDPRMRMRMTMVQRLGGWVHCASLRCRILQRPKAHKAV